MFGNGDWTKNYVPTWIKEGDLVKTIGDGWHDYVYEANDKNGPSDGEIVRVGNISNKNSFQIYPLQGYEYKKEPSKWDTNHKMAYRFEKADK